MSRLPEIACVSLLCAAIVGCERNDVKSGQTSDTPVYAIVNGKPVTVEYVSNAVMVTARTMELARRPVKPKNFARWANRMATAKSGSFMVSEMVDQELKRRGIEPTAESDGAELKKFNAATRGKYATVEELAAAYGELKPTLMEIFAKSSRLGAYMATRRELDVSDADVTRRIERIKARIARSEKVNRDAKERGDKAYARLAAGEDWEAVAKDCTEDAPEKGRFPWQEWETFRLKDFFLPEVSAALQGKGKGFVTKPLDTEQGLLIVKVADVEDGIYTCVRILFRMTIVPDLPTREEAKAEVERERRRQIQQELYDAARETSKVEFPNGSNNVLQVWGALK